MPRFKNSSYLIGGKHCSKCKSFKPVELFNKRKSSIDGLDNWCKECNKESCRKHNNSEAGKTNANKRNIERYGISVEEYENLKLTQNNRCGICGQSEEYFSRLVIDHCHDTGRVRGLLCNNCNRGIGFLGDKLENILNAARYLNGSK